MALVVRVDVRLEVACLAVGVTPLVVVVQVVFFGRDVAKDRGSIILDLSCLLRRGGLETGDEVLM